MKLTSLGIWTAPIVTNVVIALMKIKWRFDITSLEILDADEEAFSKYQLQTSHCSITHFHPSLPPHLKQTCSFTFVLTSARKEALALVGAEQDLGVRYEGDWQLMEYTIESLSLMDKNHSRYSRKEVRQCLLKWKLNGKFDRGDFDDGSGNGIKDMVLIMIMVLVVILSI